MVKINCNQYGHIKENGMMQLELSPQGDIWIFKNIEAFEAKQGICYAIAIGNKDGYDEDDISTFTYEDFLKECTGNEEVTQGCFEMSGEMNNYPDYYFDILMENDEVLQCKCGYVYFPEGVTCCPKCRITTLMDDRDISELIEG
ncbi:hypothetical protein [Clostridium estertheticum]|uniref:hypothetical protein n=1 Tax=Clostridium estertheticum TaxID=238834 RepID=UPI001C0AACC4|nr:hypothetical protein [Clostridium estertheticum]MBU3173406.1 hypothetical protein [Clostridium estertheticum]